MNTLKAIVLTGVMGVLILPPPAQANAILNGDFETGALTNWTITSSNPAPSVDSSNPHSGAFAGFLGSFAGPEPLGDSAMYQLITVPTAAQLSFWYKGNTTDVISFDWQDAYVQDASGTILATVMHIDSQDAAWQQINYDLSPFAGQSVRIAFLVHQDGFGDLTGLLLDDIQVVSTPEAGTFFLALLGLAGLALAARKRPARIPVPVR